MVFHSGELFVKQKRKYILVAIGFIAITLVMASVLSGLLGFYVNISGDATQDEAVLSYKTSGDADWIPAEDLVITFPSLNGRYTDLYYEHEFLLLNVHVSESVDIEFVDNSDDGLTVVVYENTDPATLLTTYTMIPASNPTFTMVCSASSMFVGSGSWSMTINGV